MAKLQRGNNNGIIRISENTFNQIEEYIRWAEEVGSPRNFNFGMNALVMFMAYLNLGLAQKMSAGPLDPAMNNAAAAWQIPVRRISENYFHGWKVRRVSMGKWELFNDSREAYFIEFGIHQSGARVRRPIRKLSLMKTLRQLETTQIFHRVWAEIYTAGGKHYGFYQTVQSPGMRGINMPGGIVQ